MIDFKNKKNLIIGIIAAILLLAIIIITILSLNSGNNLSLEVDSPELIEDCWVTVDGKKATKAELNIGDKIKIGYDCYPASGNNTEMIVKLDEIYSDIIEVKNDTVTALDNGNARINVEVLFPGKLGGKVTLTFPIIVDSKTQKPTTNQSSNPPHIFGNSSLNNIPSSTASNTSSSSKKDKVCKICGQKIDDAFDHEALECLNHYRCEVGNDEALHVMAPCGEHFLCDNKNHELRSCFVHYECDKEFKTLPCGHCSCEHAPDKNCK